MKAPEKALDKHLHALYGMPTIGIITSVPDKGMVDVNPAICKMLGYTREELLTKKWTDITHPDDVDMDVGFFTKILNNEINSYTIEKRYLHKNDTIIWIELSVECIKNKKNEIAFFVALIKNIDNRKAAEQLLQEELKKSKELSKNLTNRNKHLREFAHITSHNLRAPVSTITSLLNILQKEDKQEVRLDIIEKIEDVNSQLLETLDNLGEALEIQEGQSLEFKHADINYKLNLTLKFLQTDIEANNVKITTDFSKAPTIYIYPGYIQSILLNLISNAIKYKSKERPPIIHISSSADEHFSYITVSDNGLGIDLQRHKDRIFGLYKTFHRNPNAKGVGLFMVKNQVEAMDGEISIESEVDKGTTFTLKFPKP